MFSESLSVWRRSQSGDIMCLYGDCLLSVTAVTPVFGHLVMEDQRDQTCDFYRTDSNLPPRFNNPSCFHGYRYGTTTDG